MATVNAAWADPGHNPGGWFASGDSTPSAGQKVTGSVGAEGFVVVDAGFGDLQRDAGVVTQTAKTVAT